jgi:inorganic triphosphatase YgiF
VRNHLRPVFTTQVDRRACIVDRHDAKIEVVLDRGEVVVGKRRQPLLELELELIDGSPSALFEVARELRTSVPLRIGVLTKSERGERLATGKGSKAMKAEPIRLDTAMTSAQAFQTIAFACVRHFRVNEPLIIGAHDVDALHQGRVALRRLRSAFSLFRPLLHDSGLNRFKDEIRTLAATLGEARNLDVLLRRRSEELSRKSRKALVDERGVAYSRVIGALRSTEVQAMMIDFAEWIALCSFAGTSRWGEHPIGPFSAQILNRFWKKAKRDGRHMRKLDDEERHELRIVGKKLRYAMEFFSALYSDEAVTPQRDAFLDELTLVQEHLGALNDLRTERVLERELMERDILLPPRMKPETMEAEVDRHVAAADACFERLIEIGPYWRGSPDVTLPSPRPGK